MEAPTGALPPRIKVLVADDDNDVYFVTKMALRGFTFEGRALDILGSRTIQETQDLLIENPDVAVLLLDVVMDAPDAGLQLVQWIREVQGNAVLRIILRTGDPGTASELELVRRYPVNDLRLKTELSHQRLQFVLYTALRSWAEVMRYEERLKTP